VAHEGTQKGAGQGGGLGAEQTKREKGPEVRAAADNKPAPTEPAPTEQPIKGAKPWRHGNKYYSSRVIVSPKPREVSATAKSETKSQAKERTDYVAKLRAGSASADAEAVATCWYDTPGADTAGGVVLDHMNWCKVARVTYVSEVCDSSDPASCQPVGTVDFRARYIGSGNQGNASAAERKLNVTVVLDDPKPSGAPRMTDPMTVEGVCDTLTSTTPACAPSGTATKTLEAWMAPETGTAWLTFTSSEGALTGDKLGFYGFGTKFSGNKSSVTDSGTLFRCDSATYLDYHYGCIFKDVNDVFTLTVDSEVKESADLIWTAQHRPSETFPISEASKSIPGSVASGHPLTRTTEANQQANRNESIRQCKIFFGQKYSRGGRDCDEYPYASTAEGSKTGGVGTAHYAAQPLDGPQNQKAGSRLNSFFNDQRILREEDAFYVKLVDAAGSDYAGPTKPSGVAMPVTYPQCQNSALPDVQSVQTQAPPVDRFLDYAKTTPDGWTGGDSTYSVKLPDGRIAYLFSDTFLGPLNADGTRPTNARMVNSSIVIDDNGTLSTITGGTKNNPDALMPSAIDNRWYWLGDGMIANVDGTNYLQVMFQEYRGTHDGSALPFAFARNVVATFSLDDLSTPIWIDPLPSNIGVAWGSALLPASRSGDGYTYIYGVSNDQTNKKMHIARVKGSDLTKVGDWQFLRTGVTGDNWMRAESEGNTILPGVANEYSVTPWNGQFVVISQDSTEAFSNKIRIWSGCDPYGPFGFWVDHDEVYRMPETGLWGSYGDPNIFAYNPHAHPVLQSGGRWTLSYNVNSFDNSVSPTGTHYRDPSVYKPRFISFLLVPSTTVTRSSKQFQLIE
jgi:hypothetical protein